MCQMSIYSYLFLRHVQKEHTLISLMEIVRLCARTHGWFCDDYKFPFTQNKHWQQFYDSLSLYCPLWKINIFTFQYWFQLLSTMWNGTVLLLFENKNCIGVIEKALLKVLLHWEWKKKNLCKWFWFASMVT